MFTIPGEHPKALSSLHSQTLLTWNSLTGRLGTAPEKRRTFAGGGSRDSGTQAPAPISWAGDVSRRVRCRRCAPLQPRKVREPRGAAHPVPGGLAS